MSFTIAVVFSSKTPVASSISFAAKIALTTAIALKELCHKYHVPFVINDNVKIAKEMDADGVHVGQSDMEADDVRKILGEERFLVCLHRQ